MADKMFENNQVTIIGEIVSDFVFSHEVYGEGFYMVEVSVNRLSNFVDYIPDSKGAGAFMDDDLVFLCDLDFGVGGRPAGKRIILCHDF